MADVLACRPLRGSADGATVSLRALLGILLGLVARLWLATLRQKVETHPLTAGLDEGVAWALAFFHGTQWPLLAWKRRRSTVVLVSLSRDGVMQARALRVVGLEVVRGSSSRGGARGLCSLVRRMRRERLDAAFAVDGPRGPYGVVKPGVLLAARRAEAVIIPMGSACACARVFHRAWDRFALALPFSRTAVYVGAPLEATATPEMVQAAIADANARARAMLAGPVRNMVRLQRISGVVPPEKVPEQERCRRGPTNLNAILDAGVQREGPRSP